MTGGRRADIDIGKEKGERELQEQLPSRRQHRPVREQPNRPPLPKKCKVGLDSAGYLQNEWYYTLLIG